MIRHGQTEWNALHRYQGHTDIELNQAGRIQARQVAHYLHQNEEIEAVYCSDLARSLATAQIIAQEIKLPVTPDRRLREIHFGKWEGLTFREVYDQFRQEFDTWFSNTADFRAPGGESFEDLLNRSLQAVEEIAGKHTGTVAVATHGGVIMALLYHLEVEAGLWKNGVPPGSLSYFEIGREGIKVEKIGLEVG